MDRQDDKRIYLLKEEKPALAVIRLGVPLIAGMFIMVLYNLVDTFFIGLMRDDYQLAAVSLAYPFMMVLVAISNMIGTGASSLISPLYRCLRPGESKSYPYGRMAVNVHQQSDGCRAWPAVSCAAGKPAWRKSQYGRLYDAVCYRDSARKLLYDGKLYIRAAAVK